MTTKKKVNMELEAAKAVINAHREAETQRRVVENRALIGKFYKYRNSYGSGEQWWLYVAVTAIDENGVPTGWTFQQRSDDGIGVELKAYLIAVPGNGYQEITARKFWSEAARLRVLLIDQLSDSA